MVYEVRSHRVKSASKLLYELRIAVVGLLDTVDDPVRPGRKLVPGDETGTVTVSKAKLRAVAELVCDSVPAWLR